MIISRVFVCGLSAVPLVLREGGRAHLGRAAGRGGSRGLAGGGAQLRQYTQAHPGGARGRSEAQAFFNWHWTHGTVVCEACTSDTTACHTPPRQWVRTWSLTREKGWWENEVKEHFKDVSVPWGKNKSRSAPSRRSVWRRSGQEQQQGLYARKV